VESEPLTASSQFYFFFLSAGKINKRRSEQKQRKRKHISNSIKKKIGCSQKQPIHKGSIALHPPDTSSELQAQGRLGAKYLNTIIFKCYDITMIYHGIFYINPSTHV
jgi:hypothetical protein